MLEKEPKQGKKYQYLRFNNLEKIWSRIHQVFCPEFIWSRNYLVPNSPLGPEFTWSRIHLVPNSPDTYTGITMWSHLKYFQYDPYDNTVRKSMEFTYPDRPTCGNSS